MCNDYEKNSSVSNLIDQTLNSIKSFSSSSTVFGEPYLMPDGTSVIPVSKVVSGFVVGGGEYADLSARRVGLHYPMAGGTGGGFSMTPVGFIVNTDSEIKFIPVANSKQIDMILDKICKTFNFVKEKMQKKD